MAINERFLRIALAVVGAACVWSISGCLSEKHLVGENLGGISGAAGRAQSGGNIGAAGRNGGSGGLGAGGALEAATDGGAPLPADGAPSTDGAIDVVGLGDETSLGWPIAIPPAEIARRLSQFILRQPPTAALTVAIEAEAPKTNQDVGRLADALLLQEGSAAGRQAFYRWWLRLDALTLITRDATMFPLFTSDVRQALIDQTLAFVEDITWRPDGDLATLLTEPTAFVTAATAPWFPGVVVPAGAQPTHVTLDGNRFAGIITQPAVLATAGYPTRPEPSMRGRDLWARLFCETIPLDGAPSSPALSVPSGMTIRQAVESVTTTSACTGCHRVTDDPGFAFGHFDAVGAYGDTEGGLPVDTAGVLMSITSTIVQTAFSGPGDLAKLLAATPDVSTCFATKWLAFAKGAYPNADDAVPWGDTDWAADSAYVVKRATIQGRLSLRGTIRAVTETHTFLDP